MERETEGSVPPPPRPPEWVWVEAVETAGAWGQPAERPACQVCLWCWIWYVEPFPL